MWRAVAVLALATACGRVNFDSLDADADAHADAGGGLRVLYAAATAPNQVFAFAIETDGSLSALPGSPVATKVVGVDAIAVDGQTRFAMVGGDYGAVPAVALATFAIDPSGLPVQVSDADFTAHSVWSIAHPSNSPYFYAAGQSRATQLTLDEASGLVSVGSTTTFGATGHNFIVDPTGNQLFAPGDGAICGVEVSTIDAAGALSMPRRYTPTPCIGFGISAVFSPTSRHIYVCDEQFRLFGFPYDAGSGSVDVAAPLPGMPFDFDCYYLAMHPSGTRLYAPNGTTGIYVVAVDPMTGNVDPPTTTTPNATLGGKNAMVFTPDGAFAYATSGGPEVFAYAVDPATGVLASVPGSPFAAAGRVTALAVADVRQ